MVSYQRIVATLLPNRSRPHLATINISGCYVWCMWEVSLLVEVEEWFLDLCERDPGSADRVAEAIELLAEQGPALGRPAVDRLKGSRYHTMKSYDRAHREPPRSG
jgi:hypothetical protein